MQSAKTGAIILAAGYSSRMGAFKATLPVGRVPAVTRVINVFTNAGISDIAVISGYKRELLVEHIQGATEVYNANFSDGMFSSVQTGIAHFAERGVDAVWLTPADCALISVPEINSTDNIVIPTYLGEEGHPVLLPNRLFSDIICYSGSGGLRGLIEQFRELIVYTETHNTGTVLDMDTPEDYNALKRYAESQSSLV
jgi:CTP:molybdopterin cytidylyltransferase MocA